MRDEEKSKRVLINELAELRRRIDELEKSEKGRKLAEEALQVSETRYRGLFETAQDGILQLDEDTGTITDVNPFLINMLGYSHEELLGKKLWDIGLFKDIVPSKAAFLDLQTKGYVRYEDLPLETKDGRSIDVEFVSNVYMVNHNKIIQCNVRDITRRRQADSVSREARSFAESLIDTVREPFVVLDKDLKVLSASRSFYSTFEVAPGETVGNLIYDIGNRQWDIPSLRKLLEEILPKNTQFNDYEVSHKFQTIGQKTMLLNARQIYHEVVGTPMILLAIEDITEKRRMEDELRKYREHLEQQVVERTAELETTNEQLLQDITERRRAENALRESEEKYRALMDNAGDAIILMDMQGNLLEINRKTESLLGRMNEEVFNEHFSGFIPKNERERTIAAFKELVQKGYGILNDVTLLKKDGTAVPVDINSTIIQYGDRKVAQAIFRDITERKKAEEILRHSEEKFRSITTGAMDAIISIDELGRINYLNPAGERIFGYTAEETIGKELHSLLVPGKYNDTYKKGFESFKATGKGRLIGNITEISALRKDGTEFPVEISISALQIQGKWHAVGIIRDITERKRAEEALKENEERYRRLVEFSPYGIAIHSEGKLVYMNLAGAKILGTENPDEFVGKTVFQIIHPDYHEIVKKRVRMQEEGKVAPPLEEKFLRLDGTSVDVEIASIPFTYMGKLAMYGVFRDITERKQAEDIQRKLSSAVEHTADIVIVAKKDGIIEYVNPAFEKITGYTMEEAVGKTPRILKSGKQDTKFYEHLWGTILSGEVFYGVLINKKNNGELYYAEKTITPVKDEHGTITHFVSTDKDITERKKAEEVHFENLRLEAADKAKSEFLANMSHELRTPLNSIIGFSELMKQGVAGKLDEKQEHFIDNIFTSGTFLLSLINDILDLSKIEAGKIELVPEKMSVPETIKETLSLIKEKAMKHKVLLKTEFDPELEFIEADKQRFKQILFNLLGNAVKFSKEEGGAVTITAKKEGDMAKVSVSDTGIGIKEENLSKLFHKFEQIESGISQKYGGTGLGLAITRQLVELHGGKIRAE
ncbi:MAG: PAS domain S-box protein, partial [Candidatus Methanoperedens sp.]